MKALTKEIMIDAIKGRGLAAYLNQFDDLRYAGLIKFEESALSPDWEFNWVFIDSALQELSLDALLDIYKK